jgi:hypothetical protein
MTTANMLNELKDAGLLFESDSGMTDKSRDWLRRKGIEPDMTAEEAEGQWAGDLVESVSAIDR